MGNTNLITAWGQSIQSVFSGVWSNALNVVLALVVAIVIFIVGWLVASLIGKVIAQIIKTVKLDNALRHAGFEALVQKAGFNLDSGAFIGGLIKWFIVVVFLMAGLDVLGLTQVNNFLADVVKYIPNVIVASLTILLAVVVADLVSKAVVGAAKAASMKYASMLGAVVRWAIWIFAVLEAVRQLEIAVQFVNMIYVGIVVALSLGFGLAFGLGGQQAAAEFIDKAKKVVSEKN